MVADLEPWDNNARAVGAEYGVGGIFRVPLRVIAYGGDDAVRLGTGEVPRRGAGQPPPAPGIDRYLPAIVPQTRHRCAAGEYGVFPDRFRQLDLAVHPLQIRHGAAHLFGGKLQPEAVPRLQQHILRLHKPLTHCPVGGLPEIAALGVLFVGAAGEQRELDIRDRRTGEHAAMLFFQQMR